MRKFIKIICFLLSAVLICFGSAVLSNAENIEWTDWLTEGETPSVYYETSDTRTEYRTRNKITTTSYETSLSGYTQNGYKLVDAKTSTVSYANSFPSGFDKSNSLYSKYNKSAVKASENDKQKVEINSTTTQGYIYWHWCMNSYAYGPENRGISGSKSSHFPAFHAFETSSAIGYTSWAKCYQSSRKDVCKDTYWWYGSVIDGDGQLPIYKQTYTTYNKLYNYYKWSDWSEWSTEKVESSASVEVQTRITRQYKLTPNDKAKQKITVKKTSYAKTYGNKSFSLNAKTTGDGSLSYTTSNKKVATVSSKGRVTIKGCGATTIKIKASETDNYKSTSKKIKVKVKPQKIKIKNFGGNKKTLKIYYKKQNNADGYQCIYNRGSKKIKTTSNKNYVVLKNLQKGTCIAQIRAYKKISGKKVYGDYGKIRFIIN